MPHPEVPRRGFLHRVSGAGLATAVASPLPSAAISSQLRTEHLPTVQTGDKADHPADRRGNPIGGYSYGSPKLTRHMLSYLIVERTTEFLLNCEQQGITTFQSNLSPTVSGALHTTCRRATPL
jgi:hypothetical protein